MEMLEDAKSKPETSQLGTEGFELAQYVFDLNFAKQSLIDFEIDVEKLTIGFINEKRLECAHTIISNLQNILLADNAMKHKAKVVQLTNDFYKYIPHNFGLKTPPILDHLVRLKDKTRMLE